MSKSNFFARNDTAVLLLGILLGMQIMFVLPTLRAVQEAPVTYYYLMPASNRADFDRDGIPNYIDDSNGNGINDQMDASQRFILVPAADAAEAEPAA